MAALPIIDVTNLRSHEVLGFSESFECENERLRIGRQIRTALETFGFFYISGHGINTHNILENTRQFFSKSIEEKEKIAMKNWRGWTRLGSEITKGQKDWHECIDYQKETQTGILAGSNQYPDSETKTLVGSCITKFEMLARTIMKSLLAAYDLPVDSSMLENFRDNFYTFRQLYYPSFPSELSDDKSIGLGIGEHTDYGFLTLITTDQNGLEIEMNGEWKEVTTFNDYLICNIGDMLAHWSGTLRATPHRVRRINHDRYSVAYFFEPNLNSIITPLQGGDPIYYAEYNESKYTYSYPDVEK